MTSSSHYSTFLCSITDECRTRQFTSHENKHQTSSTKRMKSMWAISVGCRDRASPGVVWGLSYSVFQYSKIRGSTRPEDVRSWMFGEVQMEWPEDKQSRFGEDSGASIRSPRWNGKSEASPTGQTGVGGSQNSHGFFPLARPVNTGLHDSEFLSAVKWWSVRGPPKRHIFCPRSNRYITYNKYEHLNNV